MEVEELDRDIEVAAPEQAIAKKASEDHTEVTHAGDHALQGATGIITETKPENSTKPSGSNKRWKVAALAALVVLAAIVIIVPTVVVTTRNDDDDDDADLDRIVAPEDPKEKEKEEEASPDVEIISEDGPTKLEASPTCDSATLLDLMDQPVLVVSLTETAWIHIRGTGELLNLSTPSCGVELQVHQTMDEHKCQDNPLATAVRGESYLKSCDGDDVVDQPAVSTTTTRTSSLTDKQNHHGASGVFWQSQQGQDYQVKITFPAGHPPSLSNSEVTLKEIVQDGSAATPTISNHFCVGAQGPLELDTLVKVTASFDAAETVSFVAAAASSATVDENNNVVVPQTVPVSVPLGSMSYYSVLGTGNEISIEIPCKTTEYQAIPALLENCNLRTFITDNVQTQSCEEEGATVQRLTWLSVAGETYILQVFATTASEDIGKDLVEFEFTVFETVRPDNDLCANATPLALDDNDMDIRVAAANGTTAYSTAETSLANHGMWFAESSFLDASSSVCPWIHGPGVWFMVTGRGNGIRASTCNGGGSADNHHHHLAVYQGDCTSLKCVVNRGEWCGSSSSYRPNTLTWFGKAETNYYIYVQRSSSSSINSHNESAVPSQDEAFSLQLSEFVTPPNDFCSGAVSLDVGSSTAVSTAGATAEFVGNYRANDWGGALFPGVFYQVLGTGNVLKASAACDDGMVHAPLVHVYKGACDSKQITGSKVVCEPDSSAYWESVQGEVYHVLYQSSSTEENMLSITEEKPALNDLCPGAFGPLQVGSVTTGDTRDARFSQYHRKTRRDLLSFAQPGLFYTVMGTGKNMKVSTPPCDTSDESQGSVMVSVYSGLSCDERSRLADAETVLCNPSSSVTWPTTQGQRYFIEVQPFYVPGRFNFTLTEIDP